MTIPNTLPPQINSASSSVTGNSHGRGQGPAQAAGAATFQIPELAPQPPQAGTPDAPGKSANSVAHRARLLLQTYPELAGEPFGRLVSQVARGLFTPPTGSPSSGTSNDSTGAGASGNTGASGAPNSTNGSGAADGAAASNSADATVGSTPAAGATGGSTTSVSQGDAAQQPDSGGAAAANAGPTAAQIAATQTQDWTTRCSAKTRFPAADAVRD